MTRDDNVWVHDLFTAGAQDWTPAHARHACRVLFAPVSFDPEAWRRCASVLSDAELRKAASFLTEASRTHFGQKRAFRRYCAARALGSPRPLAEIPFEETEKGCPYLPEVPDLCLSFSSCRLGFLGAWSATHGIGVDIEDQRRNLDAAALAQRYFSTAEAQAVESVEGPARRHAFFQLWTLKEAALKSIGEGLPFGLEAFAFELVPTLSIVHAPPEHGGAEKFHGYAIGKADSCAALVLRSRS